MQDGATQIVEIKVECPKCRQESVVRVSTGIDIDTSLSFARTAAIRGLSFYLANKLASLISILKNWATRKAIVVADRKSYVSSILCT